MPNPCLLTCLKKRPNRLNQKLRTHLTSPGLISNGSTTSRCEHARGNIHTHQFLEEQFRRVRDMQLRNLRTGVAILACKCLRFEFAVTRLASFATMFHGQENLRNRGHETTLLTDMYTVSIRNLE